MTPPKYQPAHVKRIDPREYIPQLAEYMDDLAVEVWNDDPFCLCGCGLPTQQEMSAKPSALVPYAAFRLFRVGHDKRLPWHRNTLANLTPEQKALKDARRAAVRDSLSALIIAGLIRDWRKEGKGTYADLARRSGVAEHHIGDIVGGRRTRIRRITAALLLDAMGESLRPEMRKALFEFRARERQEASKVIGDRLKHTKVR